MDGSIENRMFERFEIECVGISEKDHEEIILWIANISNRGLGLRTKKVFEENDRLLIRLKVKDIHEPITVTGSVVWVKKIGRSTYEAGFKVDPTSWQKINEVLKK